MKEGEASRPRMWPLDDEEESFEATVCVNWPSPQPTSRILSPG